MILFLPIYHLCIKISINIIISIIFPHNNFSFHIPYNSLWITLSFTFCSISTFHSFHTLNFLFSLFSCYFLIINYLHIIFYCLSNILTHKLIFLYCKWYITFLFRRIVKTSRCLNCVTMRNITKNNCTCCCTFELCNTE